MKIRKKNLRYTVSDDYSTLKELVFSKTVLNAFKETSGNNADVDEVYFFQEKNKDVIVQINNKKYSVVKKTFFLVKKNEFRKIFNLSNKKVVFYNVWKK